MSEYWLFAVAGLLVLYSLFSRRLSTTAVTGPMIFVAGGFLAGPDVLGVINIGGNTEVVTVLLELTLAVVLFSDAMTINESNWREEASVPGRMLVIGLPLTILLGFVAAAVLFSEISLWEAALIGAILAPTDASLGQAVIANRRVPQMIRQGLNVESGLNDGIALPVVLILLRSAEESAIAGSFMDAFGFLSREILVAGVVGVAVGWLGARAMISVTERGWMTPMWSHIGALALAGAAYGLAVPLDGSGFIAAWVTGLALARWTRDSLEGVGEFAESLGSALTMTSYLVLGAVFLGPALDAATWQAVTYAVLSLAAFRMVAIAVSMIGSGLHPISVAFLGWFGPRGLASIIFAGIVVEDAALEGSPVIVSVVMLTVTLSVYVHGATSWAGSEAYADWFSRQEATDPELPEAAEVPAPRVSRRVGPHRSGAPT